MAEARIQMECEGCGKTVTFPGTELGTVQECPACGGYLDVPELSSVHTVYEHDATFDRQTEELDRQNRRFNEQQDEYERQLQRTKEHQERLERQLNMRDRLDSIEEELLGRGSELLDRWTALAARFEEFFEKQIKLAVNRGNDGT